MFPGAGASVDYNEDGEPIGWDYPSQDDSYDDSPTGYDYAWDDEEGDE